MDQETSGGGHYDGLGFYHDRKDTRLFVPKRNFAMGWTVNLEHPHGPTVLLVLAAAIVVAVALGLRPHGA